jgi:hypothetical protein
MRYFHREPLDRRSIGAAEFVQDAAIFVGERGSFEKVRAVAEGFFEGTFATPATDSFVTSASEDFRGEGSAEVGGARVVGVVEESAGWVGGGWRRARAEGRGGDGCAEALEAG